MGQKVHPNGFRLGFNKTWRSRWYADKDYAKLLHEDLKLRDSLKERFAHAGVSKIEIERAANKLKVNWNMRHIGAADMSPTSTANGYPRIAAHTYHNLRLGYEFAKGSEAYFGINNVADKKPPFFASGTSGTQALDTIPGYYDPFGRSYFAGVRMKF